MGTYFWVSPNQRGRGWYLRATWITLIFVVALAVSDAALAPAPAPKQLDFIDTVLASRAVVVAIRIAIIFAAGFVVLSVAALIVRRQWLARIGPVEVEKVSDLDGKNHRLEEKLETANQTIKNLEQML